MSFGADFVDPKNSTHKLTAVCHQDTTCISLDYPSYAENQLILEHGQRQLRYKLLKPMSLFTEWPIEKLRQLNTMMGQKKLQ